MKDGNFSRFQSPPRRKYTNLGIFTRHSQSCDVPSGHEHCVVETNLFLCRWRAPQRRYPKFRPPCCGERIETKVTSIGQTHSKSIPATQCVASQPRCPTFHPALSYPISYPSCTQGVASHPRCPMSAPSHPTQWHFSPSIDSNKGGQTPPGNCTRGCLTGCLWFSSLKWSRNLHEKTKNH